MGPRRIAHCYRAAPVAADGAAHRNRAVLKPAHQRPSGRIHSGHSSGQPSTEGAQRRACCRCRWRPLGFGPTVTWSGYGKRGPGPPGVEADTGCTCDQRLSATMATQGHNGRPGLDGHSRPPRDGLCRTSRVATHHRPLYLDSLSCRVCRIGTVPHSCPWTGLVIGTDDRCHYSPPRRCERKSSAPSHWHRCSPSWWAP